jgi:hypothetical protein
VTSKGRKEAWVRVDLAADLCQQQWFLPAKVPTRHLPRAFETACGPLGPERHSLMENTPFGGFRSGLRNPNHLSAVAEFWFSGDWPPFSPNLNLLDFSTGSVLRPKGQGYASRLFGGPTSVHRREITLASGGIDLQNMPLFLMPPLKGQCHEIFNLRFFSSNNFSWSQWACP